MSEMRSTAHHVEDVREHIAHVRVYLAEAEERRRARHDDLADGSAREAALRAVARYYERPR